MCDRLADLIVLVLVSYLGALFLPVAFACLGILAEWALEQAVGAVWHTVQFIRRVTGRPYRTRANHLK